MGQATPAAFAHTAQLWQTERRLHLTAEPYLNHLTAAHAVLAEAAGYYYGLAHFLVTPLVLAWLYLRRPTAFPRLRSGLVLATAAANVVFWGLAGRAGPVLGARDDRHPGQPRHPRRGPPARSHQPGEPVRRHAQPARRLGRLVRPGRRDRLPRPVAPPGLALPGRHHAGGAGLGQPIPAGRGRRARLAGLGCSPPAGGGHLRARAGSTVPPRMAGWLWMAVDGLSAAATIGLYTTAWRPVGSSARARRLTPACWPPVRAGRAAGPLAGPAVRLRRRATGRTVRGQPVHRPGGTVVPMPHGRFHPQAHHRVTPCQGPRS